MLHQLWIAVVRLEIDLHRRVPVASRVLLVSGIAWYMVLIHGVVHLGPAETAWLALAGKWTLVAFLPTGAVERSIRLHRLEPHHWPENYKPTITG